MSEFKIIGKEFVGAFEAYVYVISNDEYSFRLWESKDDSQRLCDLINDMMRTIKMLNSDEHIREAYGRLQRQVIEKNSNNFESMTYVSDKPLDMR